MAEKHTKYEIARMIGSRALQIAMGAPFLIKLSEKELEEIGYNPIRIAQLELEEGVLPLSIKRPLPQYRGPVKQEETPGEKPAAA